MNKNEAIKIAGSLFKHYPSVNDFYITTDEQAFVQPHDADAHAISLDKKNPIVFEVNRDDKPGSEKAAVDPKQKDVASAKKLVTDLEKALDKAAAGKKPAIQLQLDAANEKLAEAEKALTEGAE